MALDINDLITAATPDDYTAKILSLGASLGLTTTAWQPGGVTRTIIAVFSRILGSVAGTAAKLLAADSVDGLISTIARGGFLDFAAEVTPDPSVPNADGTYPPTPSGWLDILSSSVYDITRTGPVAATGPVVLTNTTGSSYGPFAVGTYHLENPSTKQTYSNTAALTVGPSGDTTGTFVADVAGAAGTTVASALVPVTSLVGVTVKTGGGANSNVLTGSNAQSNASLVAACRAKLQALGPKVGPAGAYVYFATTGYAGSSLSTPITRVKVITDTFTGNVDVYLANASPVFGTVIPGGDVTAVSTFLQANVVPDGITMVVAAAVENDIAITFDVYCPNANLSTVVADCNTAIAAYINALPLGGAPITGVLNGVPGDALIAAILKAVPYVNNIENMQINGLLDWPLTQNPPDCPVIHPSPVITTHGTG